MRRGHKTSGGLEERLEPDIEVEAVLVAVEQGELVDQEGSQGKALGSAESLGRHRAMHPEDALEMLVEVLHGQRPEFMEDPTDFNAAVGVGIRPTTGGDQDQVLLVTELSEIRIV